jgi:plasmid stabilization system protein ParE
MKLRFTPRSVENIASIADYVRERNPAAAQRVRAAVYEALQDLILFPMSAAFSRPRAWANS